MRRARPLTEAASHRARAAHRPGIHAHLVDEFQDTSLAQFQLLESLTAAWQEGDGRTLFSSSPIPMQSIYRFRDAEVGLSSSAREHGFGNVRLDAAAADAQFPRHGLHWSSGPTRCLRRCSPPRMSCAPGR